MKPIYAFRRKGLDDFCTCDKRRYDELASKPNLFEVAIFYTAPPKRTWVGLPESAFAAMTLQQVSAMKYAELVLKENNT